MRIWDIPVEELCRNHLLGEHRELHAIWSILTKGKKGYAHHPETQRWRGRLQALYLRHQDLAQEMFKRGYKHHSPLDTRLATGKAEQVEWIDSPEKQRNILKEKKCGCRV
jgi:hypothetical protein